MTLNPQSIMETFNKADVGKNGKIRQGRAFWIRTYLPLEMISKFFEDNKRVVRSYAYCLHDKDETLEGEPVEPHYHVIIRTYSQFSRARFYKLLVPFLWSYNRVDKVWERLENSGIDLEISSDFKACYRYLTHKDNPEKYQYPDSDVFTNDADDFGKHADKSNDNSFQIVADILDGMREIDLLKRYGREYVYHREQYRRIAGEIYAQDEGMHDELETQYVEFADDKGYDEAIFMLKNYRKEKMTKL